MSLRSKLYKGVAMLAGGQVATQSLTLLRNIIVARMLSPDDMGIAATFAMTITFLEMISNLAVDMYLVQAKEGDDPSVQGVAHLFQLVRGLLIGILLYMLAHVVAEIFNTPQAEWAYEMVALVPVIRGFMHLDWKREQRHLKYKPVVIVEALPQLLATICAFPMVIWLHDYSAVLWLVMIQAVSSLLFSHVVATRAYRLSFNRKHLHGILVFGWPLTVNGLLIFIGMQGDRFIIGANYSMADLGIYSVSISLVLAAIMVVSKFSISLLLPVLSSAQEHPDEFRSRYQVGACILAMSGGMIAMPFLVFGGDLVTMIFGDQYDASHAFVAWFGALVAARVFRIAPTIAALAHGDTINSMIANLYRMLGVLAAMLVAWQAMPLAWIIVCGAGGELVAFIAATYRIYKNFSISIRDSLFAPLMITGVLALTAVLNAFVPDMLERTIVFLFATALLPVLMLVMFPFLRSVFNSELLGLRKLITGA